MAAGNSDESGFQTELNQSRTKLRTDK